MYFRHICFSSVLTTMYLHTLLATGLVGIAVSTAASIPTAQNAPFSVAKSHEILLPDGYVSELSSERVCTGADCDSSSTPYLVRLPFFLGLFKATYPNNDV